MQNPIQRFNDWRRERRILAFKNDCLQATNSDEKRRFWVAMVREINERSAAEVARRERRFYAKLTPPEQAIYDRSVARQAHG